MNQKGTKPESEKYEMGARVFSLTTSCPVTVHISA